MREELSLLRRIQDGDKRAFRELAERFAPNALALATRVTSNRDLAEEAVQDAFFDVWRKCDTYDVRRGGLRQWVLGVVHHKAVDAVRRERTASAAGAKGFDEPAPPTDPEEAGWMSDRRARVKKAVDKLPAAQREAIMLAYFGGLTYRQVAERLGIPEGTAKSRMRDGLMTLRGLLERYGIGRDAMGMGWSEV